MRRRGLNSKSVQQTVVKTTGEAETSKQTIAQIRQERQEEENRQQERRAGLYHSIITHMQISPHSTAWAASAQIILAESAIETGEYESVDIDISDAIEEAPRNNSEGSDEEWEANDDDDDPPIEHSLVWYVLLLSSGLPT